MSQLRSVDAAVSRAITVPHTLELLAFLLPAVSFLEIRLVGRLIVSELLALALLPWLFRLPERLPIPRWLIVLLGTWLAFQVASDLVVRSAFADWTRGWAAIVFTLVDLVALLALAATPHRARIFAVGLAAGGLLGAIFAPDPNAATDPWKWALALPVGLLLAAGLSGAPANRRPWLAVVVFALFGIMNALSQYRSLSGVALIAAVYLLFAILVGGRRRFVVGTVPRAAAGVSFYAATGLAVFVALNAAAAGNLLGDAAKAKYDAQAGVPGPSLSPGASASTGPTAVPNSNPLGVLAGGRSEILTSPMAIRDSPILGHGSWAKDAKYAEMQRERLIEVGVPNGNEPTDPNLIPTHSYLLGSWVWAGFGGGLFWFAIAALAAWVVATIYPIRTDLKPLIVFMATLLLWNIAFSPYGNTQRIFAMFAVTLCLLGLRVTSGVRSGEADLQRST